MDQGISRNEKWAPTNEEKDLMTSLSNNLMEQIGIILDGQPKSIALSALITSLMHCVDSQLYDVNNIIIVKDCINIALENIIKEHTEKNVTTTF